jgi:hypothetical protein
VEKIINELRVIETDDGFRIEVKGDKEQIRAFMSSLGKHKHGPHGRARRGPGQWGPFGFAPWMWMNAARCHDMWDFEVEEEEIEETTQV